ncbi:MAG TPA: type II toxin-antitoxin system VapC family toxin [Treponema sp.]|nr:type II toxin-antitoxin system VapC family toxin [Treponema sp.]HKM02226.1 PIN domain-containing protein [Sedimentibacter sp.]
MSKKKFIDLDIILDLLCKRDPFYQYAAEIFTLGDTKKIDLVTTSLVFANVFYILIKILGISKAKELLRKLRIILTVVSVDEKAVDLALNSKFNDFEDGLQYFTARENKITIILTRNVKDYKEKDLRIQTPQEYLKTIIK